MPDKSYKVSLFCSQMYMDVQMVQFWMRLFNHGLWVKDADKRQKNNNNGIQWTLRNAFGQGFCLREALVSQSTPNSFKINYTKNTWKKWSNAHSHQEQ